MALTIANLSIDKELDRLKWAQSVVAAFSKTTA